MNLFDALPARDWEQLDNARQGRPIVPPPANPRLAVDLAHHVHGALHEQCTRPAKHAGGHVSMSRDLATRCSGRSGLGW